MCSYRRLVILGLLALCSVDHTMGQTWADDFPPIYNSPSEAGQSPMPAVQAAQSMTLPAGFRASIFASEPDVQNPIDMAWDAKGRLWIAENYTYAERAQRFDLGLRDRVVVLEDEDGDGKAEKRTVFTDAVQMLTSVEVGMGGVWLMCPPQLLFIPDANHDLVPDGPAEVVVDGFHVAKDNYHNFANGLRFGPDGWLYGRCGGSCPGRLGTPSTPEQNRLALEGGIWRYHPTTHAVEVLTHGTTNPWGHDWDATGECFFINTVNGHLWHMIPGAHFVRPFTLDPNPRTYEMIDMHADHWHFDTTGSWTDSRDGAANEFGGGHAHCGLMIYLGGDWPEKYHGQLLTLNIHGQRANHEHLERNGSGFVGKHRPDMFVSKDPFFRGMELMYGPTGSVFVIDWSDTGECHEHTGVHRTSGRVFELAYAGNEVTRAHTLPVDLYSQSTADLLANVAHENEWFYRQAKLVLAERAAAGEEMTSHRTRLTERLRGTDTVLAFRALMMLHAIGLTDQSLLTELLTHEDESLRCWAIRLATEDWLIDDCFGPVDHRVRADFETDVEYWLNRFCNLGADDPSGLVRLTLASTLQRLPQTKRLKLASSLASRAEDADDHNLPLMIWYGIMSLADQHAMELAEFAIASKLPKTKQLAVRRLAEEIDQHPAALELVIAAATVTSDESQRRNLITGIADGLKGWRKANKPAAWDALASAVDARGDEKMLQTIRELSLVFGDGRAMDQLRQIVLDNKADIGMRRSSLQTLVNNRSEGLREICTRLLGDARLNVVAAEGLATFDDAEVGQQLIAHYRRFRSPERPKVISLMVSRPTFAASLLDSIESGKLPAAELTAFDVRQLRSLGDETLNRRVSELWGDVRETSAEKTNRIEMLKEMIQQSDISIADKSHGRAIFAKSCMQCHRMYGEGEMVGPELTGSNRNNLDYLLENMVDPSAVVGKDFRMTVLLLDDGRVINGMVVSENDRTLTIQTQTERSTMDIKSIENRRITNLSPMPEGLLDNLDEASIRDLIGYLMHPSQVSLPADSGASDSKSQLQDKE